MTINGVDLEAYREDGSGGTTFTLVFEFRNE